MTRIVNVHEAKTHLSRLLEDVARGEEVAIAKRGKRMARLVPETSGSPPPQRIGWAKDIVIGDDFFEPIDDLFEVFNEEEKE